MENACSPLPSGPSRAPHRDLRGMWQVAAGDADGPKANWLDNPLPVTITRRPVTSATRLRVILAPGSGQTIRIRLVR
jgi:hypothetical protein